MMKFAWIALGGAGGSVMRYVAAGLVQRWAGGAFPAGTLLVNVLGCFAIGCLATPFQEGGLVPQEVRLLVMVGLLGGFTTFSTFGLETIQLLRDGEWFLGMGNVLLSNALGLMACWLGLRLCG